MFVCFFVCIVVLYVIGLFGIGGYVILLGLVLMYFFIDNFGVVVLVVGFIVIVVKVWDVLIDFLIGVVFDW